MKLTDLDASFVGHGGDSVRNADGSPIPRREGCGLYFDCPCGCGSPVYVPFANPIDGGPCVEPPGRPAWTRTGDTIETLTLSPSVLRRPVNGVGCSWHGWIRDGEAVSC